MQSTLHIWESLNLQKVSTLHFTDKETEVYKCYPSASIERAHHLNAESMI